MELDNFMAKDAKELQTKAIKEFIENDESLCKSLFYIFSEIERVAKLGDDCTYLNWDNDNLVINIHREKYIFAYLKDICGYTIKDSWIIW